jgi:hypothetical protein
MKKIKDPLFLSFIGWNEPKNNSRHGPFKALKARSAFTSGSLCKQGTINHMEDLRFMEEL